MRNILCLFTVLLIPAYIFAEKTVQEKVQNILNDKTIDDAYTKFKTIRDACFDDMIDSPFEEAFLSLNDILLPFVDKNIKDKRQLNRAKALIYLDIGVLYECRGEPGDYAICKEYAKKAVESADISENDDTRALVYRYYGYVQSTTGSVQLAHKYFYQAIDLYEQLDNYADLFLCYYYIAENQVQTLDNEGMFKIIKQMQAILEKPSLGKNPLLLFRYYSIVSAYHSILFEHHPETIEYADTMFKTNLKIIELLENHREEVNRKDIAFDYYNMASSYNDVYPEKVDSIFYFLDKALAITYGNRSVDMELEACVYIEYAKQRYKQKKYEQAEKDILHALSILDQFIDNNSVILEVDKAYRFIVELYETLNRPVEALKYHKLFMESEQRRYKNEKIAAMTEMLVKYEAEKKEEQVERLKERNETAKKINFLTVSLTIVMLIVLIAIIRLNRLRRKNYELSIYETALLAELKQSELEQNRKEKEQLQQQYADMKTQADQTKQEALLNRTELTRIKQQLEQKPTKAMIGKLCEWLSEIYMEKSKKDAYIKQLSELDVEMLEQGYFSADEKISNMDMKYIVCFAIDMPVKDMSLLFNVEPASIRSVRYRIKKKFGKKNTFKFLM